MQGAAIRTRSTGPIAGSAGNDTHVRRHCRPLGFKPVDRSQKLGAGAHFIARDAAAVTENDQGWMTSVCYSPHLETDIGLGFITRGHERIGERVIAADPLRGRACEVEIVSAHFVDPQGERLRG